VIYKTFLAFVLLLALPLRIASAQFLLVPMDESQRNHLKAYGVTFQALKNGQKAEWLLNYRGGSFLLPDAADLKRRATLEGVTVEPINDAAVSSIRAEIAGANMDAVVLERAPKIAIYRPANQPPWDDAVTLALQYAGIDFTSIWDDDVLKGDLPKYDWVHLHHEDFTGQFNKLYLAYRDMPWFQQQRDARSCDCRIQRRHRWALLRWQSTASRRRREIELDAYACVHWRTH
jgi:hypothetical protein